MKRPFRSVWTRETGPAHAPGRARKDQRPLSRPQIVRAAMELLDAEGLEALSMRRLGTRLDAGATSLYWHVANKEELLELVLDEVHGEIEVPDEVAADWRAASAAFAYGLRAAIFRHPWMATLLASMPNTGPNALANANKVMGAFHRAGYSDVTVDFATAAVMSFTLGATLPEIVWRNVLDRSGMTDQDWTEAIRPAVEQVAEPYPDLLALHQALKGTDVRVTRALSFEWGLNTLLDGLAARLDPDRARADAPSRPA